MWNSMHECFPKHKPHGNSKNEIRQTHKIRTLEQLIWNVVQREWKTRSPGSLAIVRACRLRGRYSPKLWINYLTNLTPYLDSIHCHLVGDTHTHTHTHTHTSCINIKRCIHSVSTNKENFRSRISEIRTIIIWVIDPVKIHASQVVRT